MSARSSSKILFFIAALTLGGPFTHPAKAEGCQCGSVVINNLMFLTQRMSDSNPGYPDIYYLAGRSFTADLAREVFPESVGVAYEAADDFSMKVQDAEPFQLIMGSEDSDYTWCQDAEITFSCGVERVEVNGCMLSTKDKGSDVAATTLTSADYEMIALERHGCGVVLKITLYLSYGGGETLTITPYKSEGSASCSGDEQSEEPSSAPGPDPDSSSSSSSASFSSGLVNGVSNGLITWSANTAAGAVTLDSLTFPGVAVPPAANFFLSGTEYNKVGNHLQYKTDTQLFDVLSDTNSGTLTLKFYNTSSLGSKTDGFYNPSAGLVKTITYTKYEDTISIEKTEGGNSETTHVLEWSTTQGTTTSSWTDSANSRKLVTIRTANGNNRVVTNEEWSADGSSSYTLISRTSREYQPTNSGGFLLYKTTEDPTWAGRSNPANVTETIYYNSNGVVERRIHSDGSWSIYTSGSDDNFAMDEDMISQNVTYTPWLDSSVPESGVPSFGNCVARVSRELSDGSSTTETYTAGVLGAKEIQTSGTTDGYHVETTQEFTGNSESLTSQRWIYPSSNSFTSGRPYRSIDPSGRVTTYSYEKMSYDTNGGFEQDNDGTLTGTYSTEGTGGSPEGVLDGDDNSLSTRTFTVTDEEGRTLHIETQAYTGNGGYDTMTVTDYSRTFDVNGHLETTTVTRDGRVISYEQIISGTETHTTDDQGILQIVTTDSQGRTLSSVRAGVTTTYAYSPQTTTITQSASGLSSRTTTTVTNLLGETVSSTDEFGTVTTYTHDHANRSDTETRNGIYTTNTRYCDGREKSTTGNGIIPNYMSYQIGGNGFVTTTTSIGAESSPRWEANTTDWAGRTRTTTRPGPPNGNSRHEDIVTTYHYDSSTGQLYKTSASVGHSPILNLSDTLGVTTSSGLDVDGDGALLSSNGDRLTTRRTFYQSTNSGWWQITDETVWITPAQSQTARSARQMSAAGGETQSITLNFDTAHASTTTVTRSFDRTNLTITTTTNGPAGSYSSTDTANGNGTRVVQTAVPDITNPANPQTSALEIYQYDPYGRPVLHTDPRGATTLSFHYSSTNQLQRVTDQLGNSTHYTYYPSGHVNAGLVQTVTDNGGGTSTTTYNSRGQTEEITGSAACHQLFVYDTYGDQYSLTTYGTATATTTWYHDGPTGLLTFKEYQGGNGTHYTYTDDGKTSTRLWQRGVTTTYNYNSITGDLTQVTYLGTNDTTPSVTFSNHDFLGRPHTVVESRGNLSDTATFSYDPVSGAESTTYASNHSLLPNLSLIAKDPNANGYPTGYNLNNGSNPVHDWTYTNDAFGRIASLASGNFSVEFSPQPGTRQVRDQITKLSGTTIHQSTRAIDMLGRAVGMVSRAPDPSVNGHPVRIIASAGHHYDARSRRKDTRREDGTLWQYGYNDRSEVTSAVKTTANSQLVPGQSFGYVFDGMGNRITSTAGTGTNTADTNYGRDALNRYTSIATPGVADILARSEVPVTFTVDGNAVSPTSIGNLYNGHATVDNSSHGKYFPISITDGTTTKTGHRWLPPASVSPQYDDDGNLRQDGRWTYDWDAENRLVRLTTLTSEVTAGAPDLTIEYSYDWRSRNIGRKVTLGSSVTDERIIYDGWNPVAEFSVSSGQLITKKTLLWGPDLSGTLQGAGGVGGLVLVSDRRSATAMHYIPSYNTNGDIIAWIDSTGQLIRRMDYDPFGNLILCEALSGDSADLDRFLTHGFSTKPADPDTGLLYYGYRWYDPLTGRWPSMDMIEEMGGLNLYGFVGNDGVNGIDELGLALYSFDGTANVPDDNTNVWLMRSHYSGEKFYESGIGNSQEYSIFTQLIRQATGWGLTAKRDKMLSNLKSQIEAGDLDVDVIGFSRGAVTAIAFAEAIEKLKKEGVSPYCKLSKIRFMGLYDPVPGPTMSHRPRIPSFVSNTSIAYALDEKRTFFATKVYSGYGVRIRGFRGGHSDIGGGYPANERGLADISFFWMTKEGISAGAPFGLAARPVSQLIRHQEVGASSFGSFSDRNLQVPYDSSISNLVFDKVLKDRRTIINGYKGAPSRRINGGVNKDEILYKWR
jgi:RHS repeat-associated protein